MTDTYRSFPFQASSMAAHLVGPHPTTPSGLWLIHFVTHLNLSLLELVPQSWVGAMLPLSWSGKENCGKYLPFNFSFSLMAPCQHTREITSHTREG